MSTSYSGGIAKKTSRRKKTLKDESYSFVPGKSEGFLKGILIVLFLLITPRVFAQNAPYTSDANTVLLDHFDGSTSANILAYTETGEACTQEPSATPSYSYISGPSGFNQALMLNPPVGQPAGSPSYLEYPGGELLSVPDGSLEFYVYLTAYGPSNISLLEQGQYYHSCGGWTFGMFVSSTGQLSAEAWAAFSMNSGTAVVPINTWTHVAATWGSTGAKLYINGTLVGSDVNTGSPASGYGSSVMMLLGTHTGYSGCVDELRISNIQRTYTPISGGPAAPQNLIAASGAGQVTLKWKRNTEADFLRYRIYEGNTAGSETLADSSSASITDTMKTLTGLANGTPYYFRVTAVNNAGVESGFSNEVSATPESLNQGLLAYYPFSGNADDSSGNGNDGTSEGATLTTDRFGNANSAYGFDGSSSYIFVADPIPANLQIQNEITLSAWIFITGYPNNGEGDLGMIVGSQNDGTTSGASIFIDGRTNSDGQTSPAGHIHFEIGNGSWHMANADAVVPLNQWVMVTASRKANEDAQIYYNGVLQPSTSVSWDGSITYSDAWFAIGRQKDLGRLFTGSIDDIRIYNRALSSAEIDSLYHEDGWQPSNSLSAPVLASPATGSTGVSINPTLTWNAPTGVSSSLMETAKRAVLKKDGRLSKVSQTVELSYRIQLSTDSTFVSTSFVDTTVADTFLAVSGLSAQTKYYWRVNATDTSGASPWSTVWNFTTANQLSISWTQINNGLSNSYVQSLAINSSVSIFAGTYGSGVFRSTDNGVSWTQVGLPGTEVYSFAINPVGYVFAGVGYFSSGAFFSTDNGSSWTPAGLTSNNAVAALAINSSGNVFAGTYGGIYLSTDNGTDWTPVNNGLPSSPNILSLAINSSGYIFAGMGYISANQGIYLSTDNGTSWNSVGLMNTGNVRALAINSSGYIFAGTDSGVYLSTNDGKSWSQVGLVGAQVMSFAINSSGYIFAGTYGNGVYLSMDNGTSWTQANNGLTNSDVEPLAISSSGYIFAGTWGGGIYRASISSAAPPPAPTLASPANDTTGVSTSPTLTWNSPAGLTSSFLSTAKQAAIKKGGRLLRVNQASELSYRIQLSTDSTFAASSYVDTTVADTFLAVSGLSSQTKYYWRVNATDSAGTSAWSTVWSFTTANQLSITWTQINNGLTNLDVYSLAISSSGYIFAGTYGGGVYLSTNNGTSWTQVGLTSSEVYSLAINSSGYIFAGTNGGGVYLSTNNGTSWTQVNNGLTSSWVYSLAINSSGYIFAGTNGGGVYLSTNNGTSWTQVNNGLTSSYVYSLAINSSGYIFAGGGVGGVYLSTNNGTSWTESGLSSTGVVSLAINSSGYIFAGTGQNGVYLSTNNGTSWTQVGLASGYVYSLAINSSGYIFAGTYGSGVYLSMNNGTSWTQVNNGLTNSDVEPLAINSSGYIFAGTYGGGIYRASIPSAVPPPAPKLASPANDSTGVSTSPTLTWNGSTVVASYVSSAAKHAVVRKDGRLLKVSQTAGLSYRVQLSTDSTFVASAYTDTTVADTFLAVSGLSAQTKYYWRVNATDSAGTSAWSAIWSFTTGNQLSWTLMNNGLTNNYVMALAVNSSGYIFAGTWGGGVYLSTNNGTTWTAVNNGLTTSGIVCLAINSSGYIFAGTSSGVYLSTNSGTSWTQTGLTSGNVYSLAINSSGYIFAETDGGVYLSANNGTSWMAANNGLTNAGVVYSFAISVSSGYIFAGTELGVYLSTNNGGSWTQVGLASSEILSLAINSSGYIFAGTNSAGVYLSTNNGTSWSQVNNGMTTRTVQSLAINSSGYIFAGYVGVYLSTDNGASWTQTGLTSTAAIVSLVINSSGYIFAGTDGNGIYRASISSLLVTPLAPTLASPANSTTGLATNPTLTWSASKGATSYELQVSKDSTFATTAFDKTKLTSTSQEVTGLSQGTTYYWRVNATGSSGSSGWSAVWSFTTFTYPSVITVSTRYVPPSVMDSTGYRIIGLPGAIDIPLGKVITGTQGSDWDAYWDNGDDQNYYVEYPSDGRFYFMPGTAFWILSKNSFTVSTNAATVPLDTSNCYSITLHSGWNLISNPFEKSVTWSSVETLNSVVQPIYFFKGSYDTTGSFDPYLGYYFYNNQDLASLEIPYAYSAPSQSRVEGFSKGISSVRSNIIKLSLSSRSRMPLPITVGFNPTVSDTLNRLNIFAPPDNFTDMSIQIVDQNAKGYWKKLFSDVRSEVGKGQSFDIEVKNLTKETAAMKPALTGGLENCDVYLVDNGTHTFYNLKTTDSISISGAYKYKSYALLIGSGNYIDSIKAIYAPKNYELYQNYPNPFNPVTIVRYEIPKDVRVTLKVYNVLGQMVRTLVDQVQQSGYYETVFDGTGLASGVYFCRINAGNYSQVKKMALIK